MSTPAQPTIIAGTDGSQTAEGAVREAARLARATGARLVLVSAFSDLHPYREHVRSTARETLVDLEKVSDQVLQRALRLIGEASDVEILSRKGDPAEVLADVAEERGAHMIVVANRGLSGVSRFMLGSVSNKLAHHAPCDVLIVRGHAGD